jgi:SAM-dependent methyltransferase
VAAARRRFFSCRRCRLVFVDRRHLPTPLAETLRYLHHADDPRHEGHRAFLEAGLASLLTRLPPGARGLDYGAGRAGTLAALLAERGYPTKCFDPCFAPDESLLASTYDFVTCTEVIEHFHEPRRELHTIARLLRPGSFFAITTALADHDTDLATWWYARDETHVSFYRRETLAWIGDRFGWALLDVTPGGALFVNR